MGGSSSHKQILQHWTPTGCPTSELDSVTQKCLTCGVSTSARADFQVKGSVAKTAPFQTLVVNEVPGYPDFCLSNHKFRRSHDSFLRFNNFLQHPQNSGDHLLTNLIVYKVSPKRLMCWRLGLSMERWLVHKGTILSTINPLMSSELNGLLGCGAWLEQVGHWGDGGHVFEEYILSLTSSSPCLSLLPGYHEVSSSVPPPPSYHDVLPCIKCRTMEPANHGLKLLKP
jgi:hypothetical protein